jgi:signal transduction histidine kinase
MSREVRALTVRYMGALLVVGGLLVAGQLVIQRALDTQQGDARRINLAGRQRMLSQRLCMLMLADRVGDLTAVASEWETAQIALRRVEHSGDVEALFQHIDGDFHAILDATRGAVRTGEPPTFARVALEHQDAFLSGMDAIVAAYEMAAHDRVVRLRRIELALLALALVVLVLEGVFVFRPALRALEHYLAERSRAQQAILDAGERERKRLAEDLHDGLGQHLLGVAMLVKSLPAGDKRDEIGGLLAVAIDQTRHLARGLYSHTLEVDGLYAALRELAAHTEKVFGIACRVTCAAPEPPKAIAVHVHRIVGEAVLNAAKHAKPTTIEIALAGDTTRVTLEIRDDGVGMEVGAPTADGLGLRLMEYRARMMGAELRVAPGATAGTTVTCVIPLEGVS